MTTVNTYIERVRSLTDDIAEKQGLLSDAHWNFRSKMKRLTIKKLRAELERMNPEGLVAKVGGVWRYKALKNKPWGSCPHLETWFPTEKRAIIESLVVVASTKIRG